MLVPATESPEKDNGVDSKDIVVDDDLALWVRIYRPPVAHSPMPVCVFFHGGGFCIGSPSWKPFHVLCTRVAALAEAIVVSVNYRLAPEHRLPAAYDDCYAALSWLRNGGGGDTWIHRHADLSKIFLVGDSAGGNIVHHVALKEAEAEPRGEIRGLVMVQPSFAGEVRTAAEAESPQAHEGSGLFRKLSLPEGANRDHHFCNPLLSQSSASALEAATLPPIMVVVGGRDILRDRQREYYEALVAYGKEAKKVEYEEEDHAFYAFKPEGESTTALFQEIALFVKSWS